MSEQFDIDQSLTDLRGAQVLPDQDGIFTPLIKQLIEGGVKSELESHIESDEPPMCRIDTCKATTNPMSARLELDGPGEHKKSSECHNTDDIEGKILSMYGLGMGCQDIASHLAELYGLSVPDAMIDKVTDRIIPGLKLWQQRSLKSHYPFIWLDRIQHKVKQEGHYDCKAVYTVMGLNLGGIKEVLGLYLYDDGNPDFGLNVMTDLRNRGVEDILIASVDRLTGFLEAINSIFPKTEVQLCIIHQIRNSLKYVASNNKKAFMADLKPVYEAVNKEAAEIALDVLECRWGNQYPVVLKSWCDKWGNLSVYFKCPTDIRRAVYSTNAIETVHRQYRKMAKTKRIFPNENSLMKLLYSGVQNTSMKRVMPLQNWKLVLSQLSDIFVGRFEGVMDLDP